MLAGRAGLTRWCHYLCEASVSDFGCLERKTRVWLPPELWFHPEWTWLAVGITGLGELCAELQQIFPKHLPELPNRLAGSRAPAEGVEQGPGPRDWGGGPSSSWATAGPALLSYAPLWLQRLLSCLGTTGEQQGRELEWAAHHRGIRFANPGPEISLISINSNLFALSGTNLKICFKSWLGTWYSVFWMREAVGIAQQWQEEEKSFVNKKWMFISQMKPCYYKEVLLFLLNLSKNSSRFLKWLQSPLCSRGRTLQCV